MLDTPQSPIEDHELNRGLRWLLYDGVFSQVMLILTTGTFLVAFALMLGASNKTIGVIAAIGPLAQILQIPAIYLINWTRRRRSLTVFSALFGRLFWLLTAALPWFAPVALRIPLLLLALVGYFGLGAVTGCSFNSWVRDFIPERIMGAFFARRMALATAIGAALSLVAGISVDLYAKTFGNTLEIYSVLFTVGAVAGLISTFALSRVPEPAMCPQSGQGLLAILYEPLRDRNYRNLIAFLGSWNFAVTFAAPFFIVYMLKRLELTMTWIIGLSVVSQMFNVLFFRVWGRLSDRFTNKSVLSVSGPLFIVSFLIWPFLTLPGPHFLTMPLLVLIHVLGGVSSAGVALCAGNLALKSAPYGRATAFLAVNALMSGIAATVAPIIAGFAADWFAAKELGLTISWGIIGSDPAVAVPAFSLRGLDFLFVIAFFLGLYSIHRLLAVKEEGEVAERIVIQELYAEVRKLTQNISNIPGIRQLTHFPYALLRRLSNQPAAATKGRPEPSRQRL